MSVTALSRCFDSYSLAAKDTRGPRLAACLARGLLGMTSTQGIRIQNQLARRGLSQWDGVGTMAAVLENG